MLGFNKQSFTKASQQAQAETTGQVASKNVETTGQVANNQPSLFNFGAAETTGSVACDCGGDSGDSGFTMVG